VTKWIFLRLFAQAQLTKFSSFRLIEGEVARSLAAFCGPFVFLDVALTWVVGRSEACLVTLRNEDRPSGYRLSKLAKHFFRLVITSGTRPLRLISMLGLFSVFISIGVAAWAVIDKLRDRVPVQGWTSTLIVLSFFSGSILISLGVVAEYLGATLNMAMGKPLYSSSQKLPLGSPSRLERDPRVGPRRRGPPRLQPCATPACGSRLRTILALSDPTLFVDRARPARRRARSSSGCVRRRGLRARRMGAPLGRRRRRRRHFRRALAVETSTLSHVLMRLQRHLEPSQQGRIFLASSAGGVYGGTVEQPIDETSPCKPISAYGRNKLRQEELVSAWASTTIARPTCCGASTGSPRRTIPQGARQDLRQRESGDVGADRWSFLAHRPASTARLLTESVDEDAAANVAISLVALARAGRAAN
jgi:hypothetical protein